ncbi:hypothetical protein [Palleronia caenipelagi]|uniref:Uncharacterized protein n=1 Tax=Palleronia caenipelagi TaxID=2489174 RepID=A0A547PUG1_9RHOB|nr:hypothetical protein [Palleronia caenipelagi]TRD17775.1 hypothetical protein FEV53_12445 [Palleronia caenipelagi]
MEELERQADKIADPERLEDPIRQTMEASFAALRDDLLGASQPSESTPPPVTRDELSAMFADLASNLSTLNETVIHLGKRQAAWSQQLFDEFTATRTLIAMLSPSEEEEMLALMDRAERQIGEMRKSPERDRRSRQLELELEQEDRELMARLERERGPDGDRDHEQEDEHER